LLAGAVEVLLEAMEGDREDRASFPFEGDARRGIVPHCGRAAAGEDQDHLLEQMVLRFELLAGRNRADVAVVRSARSLVIDEHASGPGAAPRPGLQIGRAKVWNVLRADDVEAFAAHEPQI